MTSNKQTYCKEAKNIIRRLSFQKSKYQGELKETKKLLHSAIEHLEYCGYGDSYERECSKNLRKELEAWKNKN